MAHTNRGVSNRLHTLRGEQFRREQNARRSRAHLTRVSLFSNINLPSLPRDLFEPDYPTRALDSLKLDSSSLPHTSSPGKCSGPEPPMSWRPKTERDIHHTPEWRREALSLIYAHLHDSKPHYRPQRDKSTRWIPPLTLICLRYLLSVLPTPDFVEVVVPHLPSHLRRELVRDMAIRDPLPNPKLYSLCGRDGHVGGELILVGPAASLPEGYFLRTIPPNQDTSPSNNLTTRQTEDLCQTEDNEEGLEDWDAEESMPELFHTLVLVSIRLASSTFLSLPVTLTCLALIRLPTPVPLHRLPSCCPLLEILDLSYNTWLCEDFPDIQKSLDRIEWSRWSDLQILGWRGCYVPNVMLVKLNKGRWDDVKVVQ
ncbi:hypothetical protein AMATHDRAFT_141846 [Amanita thiersii Skay4041]|uniref:Uncharacterized protein n=1 Tax=Amanita thiersii Skay4041 TaxID=703135 RepID=A0A2A9NL79_9AGAR|nr:hypothetical protein AMATHDRAFT_141846 [Amanita thiersii Skay4041]